MIADRELHRVLRGRARAAAHAPPRRRHEHDGGTGADRREADVALRGAEREHDERDLEALEEDALERERERVPVEAARSVAGALRAPSSSRAKIAILVVERLEPLARRIALRSHCSPNTSSSAPTRRRSASIGIAVSAGPSAPTIAASRRPRRRRRSAPSASRASRRRRARSSAPRPSRRRSPGRPTRPARAPGRSSPHRPPAAADRRPRIPRPRVPAEGRSAGAHRRRPQRSTDNALCTRQTTIGASAFPARVRAPVA